MKQAQSGFFSSFIFGRFGAREGIRGQQVSSHGHQPGNTAPLTEAEKDALLGIIARRN